MNDLTDGQKKCLRLVADNLTSKQIARKLNISYHTVNQRLDLARKKLDAKDRYEAVEKFMFLYDEPDNIKTADVSYNNTSQVIYDPENVDQTAIADDALNHQNDGSLTKKTKQINFVKFLQLPPLGGQVNNALIPERLFAALKIALFTAVVFAGIVSTVSGAMSLFAR